MLHGISSSRPRRRRDTPSDYPRGTRAAAATRHLVATSDRYVDPLDKSETSNQGMILEFAGGGRVVFRLSGTGSAGATVRVYVERPVAEPTEADLDLVASEALSDLADRGKSVAQLHEFVGREGPSVIT